MPGSAAYAASPLSLRLHDVETAKQHMALPQRARNTLGKALAGLDVRERPCLV